MLLSIATLPVDAGCARQRVAIELGLSSIEVLRDFDGRVLRDGIFDVITNPAVLISWEQSPRDFLRKPLYSIVWIADWHTKNGFLEPSILFFRMCSDEKRNPSLETDWGKARNVRSLIVSFLDKVVLTPEISVHPGY